MVKTGTKRYLTMRELVALAFQKIVEADLILSRNKVWDAFEKIIEAAWLIQTLEFKLYPERKQLFMPLRNALFDLSYPLEKFQHNNVFRTNHKWKNTFGDKKTEFRERYNKVMLEFKAVYSVLDFEAKQEKKPNG